MSLHHKNIACKKCPLKSYSFKEWLHKKHTVEQVPESSIFCEQRNSQCPVFNIIKYNDF